MTVTLNRYHLLIFFDAWWLNFIVLAHSGFNGLQVLTSVGFISLIVLPGLLTLLALRLGGLALWDYIGLTVGLSLIELMGVGLFCNWLMPYLGAQAPLEGRYLLSALSILLAFLAYIAWRRFTDLSVTIHLERIWERRDLWFSILPILFVLLSVFGSIELNNGGSGGLILLMLLGIAAYLVILARYGHALGSQVVPTALFFISLSLLLMTSLRGWFVTGHDVQREFLVFELTKTHGIWLISNLKDAYNACISITILPTMFSNLLSLNDPYVYKVLFQILFATVPSMLYLLARRYVSPLLALLAVGYFIAFPTFFTDMPFLNRQEIAFIFLALMFLVVFDDRIGSTLRKKLFLLFGLGMILSHYSTTYTVVGILLLMVLARPWVRLLAGFIRGRIATDSAFAELRPAVSRAAHITVWMVLVLASLSFLWSSTLTDTSSNSISRVIRETLSVIQDNTKEDAKSGAVLYGLFSWKSFDAAKALESYQSEDVARARSQEGKDTFFDAAVYEKYPIILSTSVTMPLTSLGVLLSHTGLDVKAFNTTFRQLSAKILQLLILIGFLAALWSARYFYGLIDTDYALVVVGSMVMVFSIVVLPVLSVEYGLLRAFQQSLMFLGIFVVLGSLSLPYASRRVRSRCAVLLCVVFFLSTTGVFTQILGAYDAQLHLNNSGSYYDTYYVHKSEKLGIDWLKDAVAQTRIPGTETIVQSDNYAVVAAPELQHTVLIHDVFPALIRKDAFVFLGYTNTTQSRATLTYNSDSIAYVYPTAFLDATKDLLYNNGEVKIYK